MKKAFLTGMLILLAGLGTLAADRVAMFTEVVGPVRVGNAAARTLLSVFSGAEVEVPAGARATLTFFRDGHRERLTGPCRVRMGISAATVLQGAPDCRVRSEGAPASVLAPTGQNLRRMGGGLQALADPASPERAEVQALAVLFSVGEAMEVDPPAAGSPSQPPWGQEPPGMPRSAPPPTAAPPMEPAPPPAAAPPMEPALPPAPPPPPATRPSVPKTQPPLAPGAPPAAQVYALRVSMPRLTEQRLYALPPRLSWSPSGPVRLTLARDGQEIWSARCEENSLQLPGAIPPGEYLWEVQPEEPGVSVQAEIRILPGSDRARVRAAFREAAGMKDPSAWILLMANLADQGLLSEALLANSEALLLLPEDSTLHLAAARLSWQLGLEEEAREHALRGMMLDTAEPSP